MRATQELRSGKFKIDPNSLSILTGSKLDRATLTLAGGMIETFVREKQGSWDHDDLLTFLTKVRALGCHSITEEEIVELLERERTLYLKEAARLLYNKTHPETGGCPDCGEGPDKYKQFKLGKRNVHKCMSCNYQDY